MAQSIEPFKTGTVLYSSSNLKDFTVKSKIPESKGYYYSGPDDRKLLFFISFTSKDKQEYGKAKMVERVGAEYSKNLLIS